MAQKEPFQLVRKKKKELPGNVIVLKDQRMGT